MPPSYVRNKISNGNSSNFDIDANLLMSTSTNNGTGTIRFGKDVGDVLAAKDVSHISKVGRGSSVLMVLGHVVKGELLIM